MDQRVDQLLVLILSWVVFRGFRNKVPGRMCEDDETADGV